jgi:DNA polymerase-3 subunit delta'
MHGLSSILGQEGALGILRRALASGRVAQAFLFEGAPGVGKMTTARALAQTLECETSEGCGQCTACRKVAEGMHPDVLVIERDGQFIKIAQVRQITARAGYRPHEGRVRVVIFDGADAMNLEAANALLKTLEEPPAQTHFVLVSSAPERLPVTVRSRCQRVRFAPLPTEVVAAWLERERGLAAAEAHAVAALSSGSVARAAELASEEALAQRREQALAIEKGVAAKTLPELLDAAAALKDDKENLPAGLELLRVLYRDALVTAMGAGEGRVVNADLSGEVERLAALGPSRLRRRIDAVIEAEEQFKANVNPQLLLERMMLRLREC